jgi:predicted amino acid racemase
LCVTYIHTQDGIDERFLNDVQDAVTEIQKDPNAEIGGMVRNIDIFFYLQSELA